MTTPEDNIKVILADWLDALRRHDFDGIERRMAPDVFWQGIRADLVCEDREQAMEMLREQQREGQIFQVFTLRDDIIVRVDEYEQRGDALVAAGAEGRGDWR